MNLKDKLPVFAADKLGHFFSASWPASIVSSVVVAAVALVAHSQCGLLPSGGAEVTLAAGPR